MRIFQPVDKFRIRRYLFPIRFLIEQRIEAARIGLGPVKISLGRRGDGAPCCALATTLRNTKIRRSTEKPPAVASEKAAHPGARNTVLRRET